MSISRRSFLAASSAGLIVAFHLDGRTPVVEPRAEPNAVDSWVCVNADGTVVIQVRRAEMGQGVLTSLAMIFAEEAELDWNRVTAEQSLLTEDTGGSSSVIDSYLPLRQAGAVVRELMITAAANRWSADRRDCAAKLGCVTHAPSGRKLPYGELVAEAKQLPAPGNHELKLKDPATFRLIGTSLPRLDVPDKVTGKAKYGLDIRLPGMRFAMIARGPRYGSVAVHYDPSKTLAVPGVLKVFQIEPRGHRVYTRGGVAVVATSTWAARKGREALEIQWSDSPFEGGDSDQLSEELRRVLQNEPAEWSWKEGSPASALASAGRKLEAEYEFPLLAHAAMEPMNTTIHLNANGCEVWCPTQSPNWARQAIAKELEMPEAKVTVHTTLIGGGFGRRFIADYPTEAAQIAKQVSYPVQLVWTREDDFANDFYRQTSRHHLLAALDREQCINAWAHHISSTSLRAQWDPPGKLRPEHAEISSTKPAYPIANFSVDYRQVKSDVRRGWWRSIGQSFNPSVVECFIDELAHSIGQDPYRFRRNLLSASASRPVSARDSQENQPFQNATSEDLSRLIAVLDLAAKKADWSRPLPSGRGRGIGCTMVYGSYLAQVTEVTVRNSQILVNRIVNVVDCGQAINPDGVKAQIEGATIFALSAALKEQITLKNGVIQQQNFNSYELLRLPEAPSLETFVVDSHNEPGGIGEAGVALVGATVANAVFAACGKRIRKFPLRITETNS